MPDEVASDFSDEAVEKDETEIELEKLVFGDDSGFHEGLISYTDDSNGLRSLMDGESQEDRNGLEKANLEGLDDADVCKVELSAGLAFAHIPSSSSSSTPLHPL